MSSLIAPLLRLGFFTKKFPDILKLFLSFFFGPPPSLVHKFINYAISHKVQDLNVHIPELAIKLSTFNSTSIKKLTLTLDFRKLLGFSGCWNLPALTTLHLIRPSFRREITLHESYLICLPSLETLFLDGIELPNSLNLPDLITLSIWLGANCPLKFGIFQLYQLSLSGEKNIVPHTEAASVTARNAELQEPLKSPINMLVGSKNLHKTVCIDTLDMGVQENVVQNSVVCADSDRVTQIGAPVEGTGRDSVSSSGGNSDFELWKGHEVKSEFVCLLDLIKIKYTETFENFTTKNKRVCTTKLNMLCTSVMDFTKISLTDFDTEMIAVYRDVFSCLEKFGFNVSWLVSRLKYIEQLLFSQPLLSELHAIDCHIEDAKSKLDMQVHTGNTDTKLQDLQTLRAEKVQKIHNAFGTMGKNLAVGYIGDDILSDT